VCLSVNQASSIQNMGVTLESFTLGHNPFKLGLTAAAIHLPTIRKPFLSEHVIRLSVALKGGKPPPPGMSAAALMGLLSTIELEDTFAGAKKEEEPEEKPPMFQEIPPIDEPFYGSWMGASDEYRSMSTADLMEKQQFVQEIYEGRMASLQRFVGFLVMFHKMAKDVEDFWPKVSFGMLGYDMSRSHSIMRIATTASPVSGSDVREKMIELGEETTKLRTIVALQRAFRWAARARTRSSSKEKVVTEAEIEKLRLMREQRERAERLAAEAAQKAIGGFDPLGRTASMGSIPLDGDVQVGGVRPPPAAAVDAAPAKPSMKQKQKRRPSGASPQQKQGAAEQKQRKSSTEGVPLTRDTTGTVSASSTDASSGGSKSPKGDPHDA